MRYFVESYGCTMNYGEGEQLSKKMDSLGYVKVDSVSEADIVILNTCTVVETTEKNMIRRMGDLKRQGKKVIVTGCMAKVQPKRIMIRLPDSIIIPPDRYDEFADLVSEEYGCSEPVAAPKYGMSAILPIAQGCLGNCSYCITRFARGHLRSYPEDELVKEFDTMLDQGAKEILITAQDTACYGKDIGTVSATFRGEMRLNLGTDEGYHLVAKEGDGYVNAAFTAAVQPDNEGISLAVSLQGPGLVRGIGEGNVAGLAGELAGEGTLVEIIGLGDKVLHGLVRFALDGGEFLLAHLEHFALLQIYLYGVIFFPDTAGLGEADAAGVGFRKAQCDAFALGVKGTAGIGRICGNHVALGSIGGNSEHGRIRVLQLNLRFYHHQIHGGGGLVGGYAHALGLHLQGLGTGRCSHGDSQNGKNKVNTFHKC